MSILRRAANFARSPQGRRAIDQARTRLDTPENRRRLTQTVERVRSRGTGSTPTRRDR